MRGKGGGVHIRDLTRFRSYIDGVPTVVNVDLKALLNIIKGEGKIYGDPSPPGGF